ncbi:adenine nucleotide transporter BT1, chloroplastic/mitochondrial-like [Quercus lobata]|uniref:adenine nucleotide transporter BT1, chloroplastic/mitochondrial-like n=1 Tax=Quercus lobata TaxID=97700 RepID=UPI001244FE5C|nr:adenine nucleotide transporter BT1, chloroplastic/mitochondrial-like [Quercus lobata]
MSNFFHISKFYRYVNALQGGYVVVNEKLPNYVVPDLTNFKVLIFVNFKDYLYIFDCSAGAISSTATFPLEVARKLMQAAGAINGRQYQSMLHALVSIFENEGLPGLYRGLGPSCVKLVPAAGISFMCYEACKRILVEKEEDD